MKFFFPFVLVVVATSSGALAKEQAPPKPTCPCWTQEELDTAVYPVGKVCSFYGPATTTVEAYPPADPSFGTHDETYPYETFASKTCVKLKNGITTQIALTQAQYDECNKQIVRKCTYYDRQENPQAGMVCPCWPDGLPEQPSSYARCRNILFSSYEYFEYFLPCQTEVYSNICGGGTVTNQPGNKPQCKAVGAAATGYIQLTNEEYELCKKQVLDRCDDWAESYYKVQGPGGGSMGDPHFKRFHQAKRDSFHGECDLVLMSSPQAQVDIHIRTTLAAFYSFIEQVAIRLGEDVLEFQMKQLFVNGQMVSSEKDEIFPITIQSSGAMISKLEFDPTAPNAQLYRVNWKNRLAILVKATKRFMSVTMEGNTASLTDAKGVMGDYQNGDMYGRNGALFTNFHDFAMDWQVIPLVDGHLFLEQDRSPQLPQERCRMPAATTGTSLLSRRLSHEMTSKSVLYKAATEACARLHPEDIDLCVQDVLLTGDMDMTYAW